MVSRFNFSNYIYLFKKILLSFLFFYFCRFIFFYINQSFFPNTTWANLFGRLLKGGFIYDAASIAYINIFYIILYFTSYIFFNINWLKKIANLIYFIFNLIGISINLADTAYFRYTLIRTDSSIFSLLNTEKDSAFGLLTGLIIRHWYLVILFIVILFCWIFIDKKWNKQTIKKSKINLHFTINIFACVLIAFISLIAIRGKGFGKGLRPMEVSEGIIYIKYPEEISIINNTVFSIIRSWSSKGLIATNYFSDLNERQNYFSPIADIVSKDGNSNKKNVVVFILESFSKEFSGAFNKNTTIKNYVSYTPFFDSLSQHATIYNNAFANGRKSIEALPAIFCGIPSFEQPYAWSNFAARNKVNSIFNILKPKGYHTSFFHGGNNGSMGFNEFALSAGVKNLYGQKEINEPKFHDGVWGIFDEPFMYYYAKQLNTFKQPFVSSIFTLSNHEPFLIPTHLKNTFNKGKIPIHNTVAYTDYALSNFFKEAALKPWFKNTLFVFVADHASINYYKEYESEENKFAIPILIYEPNKLSLPVVISEITQQTDILPILLNNINHNATIINYGNQLKDSVNRFAIMKNNGGLQLIKSNGTYQFDLKLNPLNEKSKLELNFMKAFWDEYSNRIVNNKLVN